MTPEMQALYPWTQDVGRGKIRGFLSGYPDFKSLFFLIHWWSDIFKKLVGHPDRRNACEEVYRVCQYANSKSYYRF